MQLLLQRLLHLCVKVRAPRAHLLRWSKSDARLTDHSRNAFKVSLRHNWSDFSVRFLEFGILSSSLRHTACLYVRRKALNFPSRDDARPSGCCMVSAELWLGLSNNDRPAHRKGWGEWRLFRISAANLSLERWVETRIAACGYMS